MRPEIFSRAANAARCVSLQLVLNRPHVRLAIAESLLPALELEQTCVDVELLLEDALLDLGDLDPAILYLALDLAPERDRLLARVDLRLAPERFGLALGVGHDLLALRARRADARAGPGMEDDGCPDCTEDDSDERCAGGEHAASIGGLVAADAPSADALTRRRPARPRRTVPGRLRQVVGRPPSAARMRPVDRWFEE